MFKKILIANRGEIACRVIKTAKRLGIRTVAVYSDADVRARHVRMADEAIRLGPPAARESYLRIDAILDAARSTGAEAIHPGYGFLSENEDFAEACERAGIVFIGPPADAIRAMGSKSAAKALMEKAGVPLTPGYHGDNQDPSFLASEAEAIGYPVLIKASAGGGGKGMRKVDAAGDFSAALASCKREAANAFGSDHVLVEKYVVKPRHIEIQVFADRHGNAVYLFERDCSVQRRHQKVLEEAPAPGMSPERRAAMGQAAVEAAKAVGYVGAGTVEFIVNQDGSFYFMEMNTRLQVEHPVTEMITGQDLVEWQLRVAANQRLPRLQDELTLSGHAIEARIYAEDPAKGFLPATGRLLHLSTPQTDDNLRVDTGVESGDEITPWYDPMIAKLIVWGEDRDQALRRMDEALHQYRIIGLANNVSFLRRLVQSRSFATADLDTGLIERESAALFAPPVEPSSIDWLLASLAQLLQEQRYPVRQDLPAVWQGLDGWRLGGRSLRELEWISGDAKQTIACRSLAPSSGAAGGASFEMFGLSGPANQQEAGRRFEVSGKLDGHDLQAVIDGRSYKAHVVVVETPHNLSLHVLTDQGHRIFQLHDSLHNDNATEGPESGLRAPMPGKVIALIASPGAEVEKGQPLLVLEAMKMEHTIAAPHSGRVKSFFFAPGDQVSDGAELVEFEANPS